MPGDARHMLLGPALPVLDLVGVDVVHICVQADLGVYNQLGVIGIVDYHVRNHRGSAVALYLSAARIAYHALRPEMDALLQPGAPEQVNEQHLAEIPLDLGMAGQGVRQIPRLFADALRFLHQRLYHLAHRRFLCGGLLLPRAHHGVELPEFFLYRLEQLGDGLGVLPAQPGAVLLGKQPERLLHLLALALERLLPLLVNHKPRLRPLLLKGLEGLFLGFQAGLQHGFLIGKGRLLLGNGSLLGICRREFPYADDDRDQSRKRHRRKHKHYCLHIISSLLSFLSCEART